MQSRRRREFHPWRWSVNWDCLFSTRLRGPGIATLTPTARRLLETPAPETPPRQGHQARRAPGSSHRPDEEALGNQHQLRVSPTPRHGVQKNHSHGPRYAPRPRQGNKAKRAPGRRHHTRRPEKVNARRPCTSRIGNETRRTSRRASRHFSPGPGVLLADSKSATSPNVARRVACRNPDIEPEE